MTRVAFIKPYSIIYEGYADYLLFAYLTKVLFRKEFLKVKFVENTNLILNGESVVSNGNMRGIGGLSNFKSKYIPLKEYHKEKTFFFILDGDLDDSQEIMKFLKENNELFQMTKYNTEYFLLSKSGAQLKDSSDFRNMKEFRDYCKDEFLRIKGKKASEMSDSDFDSILKSIPRDEIVEEYNALFSLLGS